MNNNHHQKMALSLLISPDKIFLLSNIWISMACGPLKKKTHSWTHSYSGAVQTRLKFAKFNLPHAFQPAPAPTLADSFLYPYAETRNAYLVLLGVPASLVCLGNLVAHQVLVLLWFPRCLGGLGDRAGLAGCDWSGNHLESDSASD